MSFLILHGLGGSGPEHWQSWLAKRLPDVRYPLLPDADAPALETWLEALRGELAGLRAAETTVLCHSLGCLLWLHHASAGAEPAARVLLVAPTQPDEDQPESPGFRPTPLVATGAREALLVCSRTDPYCPPATSRRMAAALGAPVEWLDDAGHVNADAGYGPWPWVERWALGTRS